MDIMRLVGYKTETHNGFEPGYFSHPSPVVLVNDKEYFATGEKVRTDKLQEVNADSVDTIHYFSPLAHTVIREGDLIWFIHPMFLKELARVATQIPALHHTLDFMDSWNNHGSYRYTVGTRKQLNSFIAPIAGHLREALERIPENERDTEGTITLQGLYDCLPRS